VGSEKEIAEKLKADLKNNLSRDIRLGFTSIGPHRDDIKIEIDGIDARKFASQGQQRTIALAMKLGEVELYKQETSETPVLLLDDVLSELDKTRRDILLKATEGVQTILTCTEFDGEGAKLFEVKEGKIVKG
jgi:DNA replication and repair protein RecF